MLSTEQNKAVNAINDWLKTDEKYFVLGGFAGTGKTYTLGYLVNNLQMSVFCCAPTNKAAKVLSDKLEGRPVSTIHKLIYTPYFKNTKKIEHLSKVIDFSSDEKEILKARRDLAKLLDNSLDFDFNIKDPEKYANALVVVDEASMVDPDMQADLEKTGAKVLLCGDPGQLPPVNKKSVIHSLGFNFVLEEVHRQAKDSPIIRLSMDIRKGRFDAKQYQYENCKILPNKRGSGDYMREADMIIAGKHITRRQVNRYIRKHSGFSGLLPQKGEQLVCDRTATINIGGIPVRFMAGVLAKCLEDAVPALGSDKTFYASLFYDDDTLQEVPVYAHDCAKTYDESLEELYWKELYGLARIDFGYCVTCHKAQGSEWDKVVVADDRMQQHKLDFRKKWLYTAVTRAKEKLTMFNM